ncbi:MAG: cation:proton antiporter [bacterium]|nr:cation:proton antiporter [bacterium]
MTTTIIIIVCSLLLLAYVFDISSRLTKIPTVFLLLFLGWIVRLFADRFHFYVPDLNPLLTIFGTIGLILIVLEGSLELELNKHKLPIIKKSIMVALIPMFLAAFGISYLFTIIGEVSLKVALINAIPFCVISSAIAIPSVRNISKFNKEFIIYESSLSDIFGILFFNFFALYETIDMISFGHFSLDFLIIIVVSFFGVIGLSLLLSRIKHHITYTPIILLIILIYAISKEFHLPGLIFILVFGLFLGNLDELKRFKWIEKFKPDKLDKEVKKFKEITIEATFLVRSLFFLLFGFLMEAKEILNLETLPWAVIIIEVIILFRYLTLLVAKLPILPLLFIAPRGLITILLFFSILPQQSLLMVNKSLIIQTILLSVLVMMFGLMFAKKPEEALQDANHDLPSLHD